MTAADDRRVTLELSMQDLRDIRAGLQMRIDALNDARPGFRCQAGKHIEETWDRVTWLMSCIDSAAKRLAKLPGGDK